MLSPQYATSLLVGLVRAQLCECIDKEKLGDLEEQIAVELGRIPGVTNEEMLAVSRQLIDDALRDVIAMRGVPDDAACGRYELAVCQQVDRELAARRTS